MFKSNDTANLLKYCVCSAAEKLDWDDAECDDTEFYPMAEIKSIKQLYECIDYIADNYSDIAKPHSLEGVGYYFYTFVGGAPHPVFVLTSLYILLKAGADIYINNTHIYDNGKFNSAKALNLDFIVNKLIDVCPKVHVVSIKDKYKSYELNQFFSNHPEISHALDFDDYANIYERLRIYEKFNLNVHTPGSYLVITNYSKKGASKNQIKNINKFGYMCFQGVIDYEAYRHSENECEDCCFGFDYADLFWGYEASLDMWKDLKSKHDKQNIVVFTDKSKIKSKIRSDAYIENNVILIEDFDCDYPVYDFKQLLL